MAAWPLVAYAQRSERLRRIGLLVVEGLEPIGPFREALSELGYVEGRNIQIVTRSAQGQESRLPQLATDLVRDHVDVIVAVQTPAAHAAKKCDPRYSYSCDGGRPDRNRANQQP